MVLVAPLNWGLGHASRCIPIIKSLLDQNVSVLLASDGAALQMLRQEFPELPYITLPSYGTNYKSRHLIINLIRQFPVMVRAIRRENQMLKRLVQEYPVKAVISDNRFGLYHPEIPTTILTHQVCIPVGIPILHYLINFFNQYFLKKYTEIWVPDFESQPNLSGPMAHHTGIDNKLRYIGPVSRLAKMQAPKLYDLLIVLSGTEPQRTILEHKLLHQLATLPYKTLLVQGKPGQNKFPIQCTPNLEIQAFLKGEELQTQMANASLVISRSGYTTIMDLLATGKNALLIPTPGQREQMFLAEHFDKQGIFAGVDQDKLNLIRDIPRALNMTGPSALAFETSALHDQIRDWIKRRIPGEDSMPYAPPQQAIA
jgi:uncharacterized protein (TIGR00661 family)